MNRSHLSAAVKRAKLGALVCTIVASTGCSTATSRIASLNPFSKATTDTTLGIDTPAEPKGPNPITSLASGTRAQVSSMGMAVKGAYGKTKDSVAGLFNFNQSPASVNAETGEPIPESDPLRLDNNPGSVQSEVLVANGQLWEASGNLERAMENYSKALESDPKSGAALASLARINYRQQRYDAAIPFFEQAIKVAPDEASLFNDLGLAYSKTGRHDEASKMIDTAVALEPDNARYANNKATVQFEAGNPQAALATLKQNNSPAVAHYNMAYLHYSNNETENALKELSNVLAAGESSLNDPASQAAVQKARELSQQLTGKVSAIAQAIPAAVSSAKQASQAVGELATGLGSTVSQATASGEPYRFQLSDHDNANSQSPTIPSAGNQGPAASPPGTTLIPEVNPSSGPPTAEPNTSLNVGKTSVSSTGETKTATSSGFSLPPQFAPSPTATE